MAFTRIIFFLCFTLYLFLLAFCSDASDADSEANKTFTGETLLDMGRRFNKPLLRLLGKSLANLECRRHHQCDEWSEWSPCRRFVGQYGAKKRERRCLKGGARGCITQTKSKAEMKIESESQICQDYCPSKYDFTSDVCLFLYNTTKAKVAAEADCQKDGGHLMIINSQRKWQAFCALLEKYNYNGWVIVDGFRKDVNSPWEYALSSEESGYTNWTPGEPSNTSTSLCLLARILPSSPGIADATCSTSQYYACEISPM